MKNRQPTPHRKKNRWILVPALLAALFLLPRTALAVLEYSTLYGMGAASFSLGPSGVPSLDDPMAYLLNPAMFALDTNRKLILTIGGMKAALETDDDYSLSAFGYQTPKSVFTIMRFQEPFVSQHNEFVITAARKSGRLAYGVNVRIFEFRERSGAKDSSATVDVGVHGELQNNRMWYDFALRNLIGPSLSVDPERRELDPELPKILTLGLGYRAMENIRLYAGYQNEMSSQGDPDRELEFSRWNIGVEYTFPERYSFRAGGSEHNLLSGEGDRSASVGAGFRSDNISMDTAFMVKNDYFSNAHALTFAYSKKDETPPPPEPVKEEPEKTTLKPLPVIEEEKPEEAFEDYKPPIELLEKPPVTKTSFNKFSEFTVEPEAILAAAPGRYDFKDLEGHWAESAVKNLAGNGYMFVESDSFQPSKPVRREDFYRFLFTLQLENLFRKPLEIRFSTPAAGTLTVELEGASLEKPLKLTSGTLKEAGRQAITLPPAIFEEKDVPPGRYKVVCRFEGENGDSFSGSAGVTVLDTAMDFDRFAAMDGEERIKAVDDMKTRLKPLGMPLDYLDNFKKTGDVSRIEALAGALTALDADWLIIPSDDVFSDTWGLEEKEKKAVYLATRGLDGLHGSPLMNGYPGGAFRPQNSMTRAEAAAFTAKLRKVAPDDFSPPFKPPWKTGKIALFPDETETTPAKPKKPRKNPYWLVALTTTTESKALEFAAILSKEGLEPIIVEEKTAGTYFHHVLFGVYSSVIEAEAQRRGLEAAGYQVYLSGPPDEQSFVLPPPQEKSEKKQPAKENYVGEIELFSAPPIPDNLDTTDFQSPKAKHERYEIITR